METGAVHVDVQERMVEGIAFTLLPRRWLCACFLLDSGSEGQDVTETATAEANLLLALNQDGEDSSSEWKGDPLVIEGKTDGPDVVCERVDLKCEFSSFCKLIFSPSLGSYRVWEISS